MVETRTNIPIAVMPMKTNMHRPIWRLKRMFLITFKSKQTGAILYQNYRTKESTSIESKGAKQIEKNACVTKQRRWKLRKFYESTCLFIPICDDTRWTVTTFYTTSHGLGFLLCLQNIFNQSRLHIHHSYDTYGYVTNLRIQNQQKKK